MEDIYFILGQVFCTSGGILVVLILSGLLIWAACRVWEHASERFRGILYRQKLIGEYEAFRDEFLAYKAEQRKAGRR